MHAVVLDVDDTLYDRMDPFLAGYGKYLEKYLPRADRREVFNAYILRGNEVFEEAMSGRMTMEEMHICRITAAMADFGVDITRGEALDFQAAYEEAQQHLRLRPGLEEALDACAARGRFMGVITNGKSAAQIGKCRVLGLERWLPEDHILPSGAIGISKPDPRIFKEAESRWGLDPAHTWYVGDSYSNDISGAKAAGWHTLWFDFLGLSRQDDSLTADIIACTPEELAAAVRKL